MTPKIVSPLEFVAIAEKCTPVERFISMSVDWGLLHDGQWYAMRPASTDDAATKVEREAAIKRAANIGREREPAS